MSTVQDDLGTVYGEMCDVVQRTCVDLPIEGPGHDGVLHASDEALAAATRIMVIFGDYANALRAGAPFRPPSTPFLVDWARA